MAFGKGVSKGFTRLHIFLCAVHSTSVLSISYLKWIFFTSLYFSAFFSSSHLFCAKVPDALIEADLRHSVVYFREFSELIHLLSVHIAHWLKKKRWNYYQQNTTWTFVYLLGFFLNLKYKVITFSTIWQHTFISTEESCFDITQLQKYLQTLRHCNWPLQNLGPHVPCDCQSTSSCPRPELCVGAGHCSMHQSPVRTTR